MDRISVCSLSDDLIAIRAEMERRNDAVRTAWAREGRYGKEKRVSDAESLLKEVCGGLY